MWDRFKTFFDTPSLFAVLVTLVCVVFLLQWVLWIFGVGRFKPAFEVQGSNRAGPGNATDQQTPIRHVIANLFVKVIDDFRHLLALIIVVIFAVALVYSLYVSGKDSASISEALQAVTGSLSGIIGVVIGYYFGESAGKHSGNGPPTPIAIGPDANDQVDPDPAVVRGGAEQRSGKEDQQVGAGATLPRSPPAKS